jgi:hypothetical protein
MNDRTKAAVIGGVVAGVLSVIPIVNFCCFLWAIGGGFLAVYMYMKSSPAPMEMGDAAKLGAVAGVVGAIISVAIGIPFLLLGIGTAAMQNQDLAKAGITSGLIAAGGAVSLIIRAVCIIGFAVLGGVIGAAVLGKNRPGGMGTPPPPPSDFGGGGYTPPPPAGGGSGTYGSGS